jgi:hypothetical protein
MCTDTFISLSWGLVLIHYGGITEETSEKLFVVVMVIGFMHDDGIN